MVLLIEDEAAISQPLAAALAREGFDPVVAGTAAEGLERFAGRSPDVVVLDVMLPDGDGRDVLRRIRETSRTPVDDGDAEQADDDGEDNSGPGSENSGPGSGDRDDDRSSHGGGDDD